MKKNKYILLFNKEKVGPNEFENMVGSAAGADRWSALVTHLIGGRNISWDI